jgi:hydroxyacylglutathione hydrolase
MTRALALTDTATWWPSVLWQTTTLAIDRDGTRLLVDPGIAPWEAREAAGDGAGEILITHADWDHVMGIGLFPGARTWASQGSAERIRSGGSRREVEQFTREYGVPLEGLDRMRVDEILPTDGSAIAIGPWRAECHAAPGHTEDGTVTWLPDEGILVAGDHLSEQEIPFAYDSIWSYRSTLQMLADLIGRTQPDHVVVGHGRPQTATRALEIAAEDMEYMERLVAFVEGGGMPTAASQVEYPDRGGYSDETEHKGNLERACAQRDA